METLIESSYLIIGQKKIHYLRGGQSNSTTILFLHGASFQAQTWWDLGTLALLAKNKYHVIAIDLPGYGKSETLSKDTKNFLLDLIEHLNLVKPIIVSPSMSGQYSLPIVVNHPEQLGGFVAVAPVGIPSFEEQLRGNPIPTLAIWGSDDHIVPIAHAKILCQVMSNAQEVILPNAGHACYMRATHKFHEQLLQFIEQCHFRTESD